MSFEKDPLELDYLPPVVAASRRQAKQFAVVTMGVIMGLVVLFFVWASLAKIDETVRGTGRIVPSQKTQMIANLEGGIVKAVLVKEGDIVEPNQVLMKIDKTIAQARYKGDREQYLSYLAAQARLQAQINGTDFAMPSEVTEEAPKIAEETMQHYQDALKQHASEAKIADEVVNQKKQGLIEIQSKLKQSQESYDLAQQELAMIEPLAEQGLTAKRDLLRLKRDLSELSGQIEGATAGVPKAQAELDQALQELQKVKGDLKNRDMEQLRDVQVKLAEEKGTMTENNDRVSRTDLRSPVKGIVKDIKVKTVGGVIQPGQNVIEIVPFEDALVLEANVTPRDIAFIHPGQHATIKITAYDFAIYGGLEGKLQEISADSTYDEQQKQWFYRVTLKADKNHLEKAGTVYPIIPGMAAEVDITTGKRTVLAYLMKPIIRGLNNSFTER